MIRPSEWVWCGFAGHFIGASCCRFHLCTRVGNYRVSTIGEYRPPVRGQDPTLGGPRPVGPGRTFETMVFVVAGHGEHGEGEVVDWSGLETEGCNDSGKAEEIHMNLCRKYAMKEAP